MAYTTINDSSAYFHTQLYTGNGSSTHAITNDANAGDFQPDWIWIKRRDGADNHSVFDTSRGITKELNTNGTGSEGSGTNLVKSSDTDGFTLGDNGGVNGSSETYVAWQWKAGGTAPAITYVVKVVSDSGNKYRFDDFGTSAVTLDLQEGGTYTFDQADSSNAGHPLRFYTASDKSGGEYTTGVTTTGTPGSSGAKTVITVAASAPTLYYQCSAHAGMGGQANTNSTFGSSNFSGSIQSTVSANTTAGFSIVLYTANATAGATVGHGLGTTPSVVILKKRSGTGDGNWMFGHKAYVGNAAENLILDSASGLASADDQAGSTFYRTAFTSTVFTLGDGQAGDYTGRTNRSGYSMVAYCFSEIKGYSKFGSYTANGNADGPFVYTGFKPALVIVKRTDGGNDWRIADNKRDPFNIVDGRIKPNSSDAEDNSDQFDFLSNGFKLRTTAGDLNGTSGHTFIYMAFGQTLVGSNNIPATAR